MQYVETCLDVLDGDMEPDEDKLRMLHGELEKAGVLPDDPEQMLTVSDVESMIWFDS